MLDESANRNNISVHKSLNKRGKKVVDDMLDWSWFHGHQTMSNVQKNVSVGGHWTDENVELDWQNYYKHGKRSSNNLKHGGHKNADCMCNPTDYVERRKISLDTV